MVERSLFLDGYESLEVAICLYTGFGVELDNYSIIYILTGPRLVCSHSYHLRLGQLLVAIQMLSLLCLFCAIGSCA